MHISKASIPSKDTAILQGDIFRDVKYNYIDTIGDNDVEIIQLTFPRAVIVSQACDVLSMYQLVHEGTGAYQKFMPAVLLCPIYDRECLKSGKAIGDAAKEMGIRLEWKDKNNTNLFNKKDIDVARNSWHYRYHDLTVITSDQGVENPVIENSFIDFKEYFTVPMTYLYRNRDNREYHLEDMFAEQVTLKFATYLSRVATDEP